jgi:uncharacterized protein
MLRLIILVGIIYAAYRIGKSWQGQTLFTKKNDDGNGTRQINDVMVKDPACNTYFPKKDGFSLKMNGQNLYFCSTDCRDKYIASQTKS